MTDPATYITGRTVQEQMNSLIGYVDARSAEVALDAIAADVAQVAADKADAHADALAAAASAAAAAGTLANAVTLTDTQTITGAKTFSVSPAVPAPTNNTDASTKKYVDDADASILAAINSLDAAVVKLTGNQTVGGTKTFSASPVGPTEATGTFSTKLATSNKVKNELDAYAPMVRTTGNQNISGQKTHLGVIQIGDSANPLSGSLNIVTNGAYRRIKLQNISDDLTVTPATTVGYPIVAWTDSNDVNACTLVAQHLANGHTRLVCVLRNSDGTNTTTTLTEST